MNDQEASGSQLQNNTPGTEGHGDAESADETLEAGGGSDDSAQETVIKNKRKQLRNKFTRAINRVRGAINDRDGNRRKLTKEMQCIRQIYEAAGDAHSELYDFVVDGETRTLDQWETNLTNDLYDIEIELEDYMKTIGQSDSQVQSARVHHRMVTRGVSESGNAHFAVNVVNQPVPFMSQGQGNVELENVQVSQASHVLGSRSQVSGASSSEGSSTDMGLGDNTMNTNQLNSPAESHSENTVQKPFDSWIDELVEFQATSVHVASHSSQNLSIADAIYKLEASRDIPTVELSKFNGNPLDYVECIEKFKIHIHDKPNLADDMRMIQLKMHVTGEAERAISGLGSGGIMYATALKLIKDQFGQRSVIARAVVNRVTKGAKIAASDRQALRDFSLDIINSLATLQQMKYFADVNANDNLRQVIKRLPDYLIRKWKSKVSDIRDRGKSPTLVDISDFLRKTVKSEFDPDFGDLDRGKFDQFANFKGQKDKRKGVHSARQQSAKVYKCFVCQDNHRVVECPTFRDSSVGQRFQLAKDNRLCFSCLNKGHSSQECRSKKECEKEGCKRFHHVMLHSDPPCASSAASALDRDCLMPVVRVLFRAGNGKCREGNVLIDSGAGTTIIRKDFARTLGLQGKREGLELSVVGGQQLEQPNSRRVKFWIQSLSGGEEFPVEAHEIERTIISVPPLDKAWLRSFPHLKDIEFSHRAGPIDLILGVQYSHLHTEEEVRQSKPFDPVGKLSRLGWYVIGSDKSKPESTIKQVNFVEKVDLEKFYQFETLGIQAPNCSCPESVMSPEDKRAMDLFETSCKKDGNRFVIGLPWKRDPGCLRNNYDLAERRLVSLENSLRKNEDKAMLYDNAIKEYERKDWARKLTDKERESDDMKPVYYLPHHGVYRPDKVSTPLRVVFDPACQFKGTSLNSLLFKGPCLIGNLFAVLLRFREDRIAFTGDISKMFLQICLPEADTHLHRFLWRNMDASREPDVYRLMRVTFGDKPSPDMASFVMLKIAEENEDKLPNAATILRRDRYMDDLIHSCETPEEACQRMTELEVALATGSFEIKKWICSTDVAKTSVPCGSDSSSVQGNSEVVKTEVSLDGEDVKTLGVCWNPAADTIRFIVKRINADQLTKRTVLSKISTLFDPLGLVSVVTIKARIGMQDVWRCKNLDWDDPLPPEMVSIWKQIFSELEQLDGKEFPRCLKPVDAVGTPEMHIFADASGKAYGAIAYLRWTTENGVEVRLISAKGRVAPLKQTTTPRLELMAALVASRLGKTIFEEFKIKPTDVVFWSDSQIVLHWLHSESAKLKAFVGVRVAEIQSTWDSNRWRFVPTESNPADDLSRGITVDEMEGRWKHGPEFLRLPKDEWPEMTLRNVVDDAEMKKVIPFGTFLKEQPIIDVEKHSSWQKLVRITGYCIKFINKLKQRVEGKCLVSESLQPDEIEKAERYWIMQAQLDLPDWEQRYRDLSPFLKDGIVRVGGRLRHAPLGYDQTHPVLLPTSHHISSMIMRDTHQRMGHVGAERTLCECRRRFWIVRGRNMAKGIVRNCVVCRKLRQGPHTTVMSDLPPERLMSSSPPFSVTGVDLFGPFNLRYGRNKTTKAWGAVFTCATVRAVHLEVVDGLSTAAFLHALRRFAAHHGWPRTIISDNGTNFVGAQAELRKLVQEGRKQLEDFASLHRVKWIFITPLSPHQGGFYESLVKQTKRALQVAIGQQVLTWNEMTTAFAEAECLLNSRPLGYAPNNPNDPQPLSPNHFILGRASAEIPSGPFAETRNLHKRFEQVQMIVNHFWKRFIREYFPTLTRRNKWQAQGRQLKIGDIVLITDHDAPRGKWRMGRILEVYPGKDGVVRNVKIRTKNGEYTRSVQRCCPILEIDDAPPLGPPEDVKKTVSTPGSNSIKCMCP